MIYQVVGVCMNRVVCFILVCGVLLSQNAYGYRPKEGMQVVIPLNNWSSQRVLSIVTGNLIEQMGEQVRYQNINASDQWGALRKGIIHLQVEVWQPSMAKAFTEMVNNHFIVDLGSHSAVVIEDWWYPEYVEKQCPDLPNWQALNNCANLFASEENPLQGIYYSGPWNYSDADLIRALDLNFTIKRLANDKSLWRQLQSAMAQQQAIIMLNWSPNWTDIRVPGKFVEFPKYAAACELDPSWGLNKNLAKDCGNPANGWLKKAAWTGLEKTWPCIYQLMKRVNFTNEMIAEASALVIADGLSEEKAAQLWMKKYQKSTAAWLDFTCQKSTSH